MKRVLHWLDKNILLVISLFLLAFIPLYPKFPLIDIKETWVYIRIEDFLVAGALVAWLIQLLRKKATLNTPLTLPIILFWIIGGLSTVFAILFIFPDLQNAAPTVAWLHFFRRIEYLSLFFVAFSAIRDKKQVNYIIAVLLIVLVAVCIYGFGQRGYVIGYENRFPAFSTMNEEFAKGEPLYLSLANRIQSTFAGHYDLAAYLVMMIPIMGGLVFGVRKWYMKLVYFSAAFMGLWLLMMTASRISFAVYLVTIIFMLVIQKQKKWIVPVIIGSILLLTYNKGLTARIAQTVTQQEYAYDTVSNKPIGPVEKEGDTYVIKQQELDHTLNPSNTGVISAPVAVEEKEEPKTIETIEIRRRKIEKGKEVTEITNVDGNFVIRRAYAVDESFAIRFQGTWPRAIDAFKDSLFLGTGYSSINLATDNNYLRMLGETGFLGLAAYLFIFLIFSLYLYRTLPEVDNQLARRFILGVTAGIFGLGVNAAFIDVFEASKIAFILWLLVGMVCGLLHLYSKKKIHFLKDLPILFTSIPAVLIYICIIGFAVFSMMLNNYFVADDYTWLKWAADCPKLPLVDGSSVCAPDKMRIISYFTNADNFFYRPGMKLYFHLMYPFAWLNANAYHLVSLAVHIASSGLVFLIADKLLRKRLFAVIAGILFLVLGSHSEAVFWISSSGHLFASFFALAGVYGLMLWRDTKRLIFLLGSLLSVYLAPLFQEVGVVAPLIVIAIDYLNYRKEDLPRFNKKFVYLLYLLQIPLYLIVRGLAQSHWSGGDYSYNLLKLPFNFAGNIIGYLGVVLFGNNSIPFYDALRMAGRDNVNFVAGVLVVLFVVVGAVLFYGRKKIKHDSLTIVYICLSIFLLSLTPVLGLGNIALRYSYLASFGIILFMVFLLMRLFVLIKKYNIVVAYIVILSLSLLFAYFNFEELKRVNEHWKQAGKVANNMLENFNYAFIVSKATPQNPVFYFVDTPIKEGQAWVFPVGLDDALWFTFQNENLTVHSYQDLELALDAAEGSGSARVFEFDKAGNIEEVTRTKEMVPVE